MDQNLSDIITLFNPLSTPFEVIYDNKSYGTIEPGKARRFPRYLARLAAKHLIDMCITVAYQGQHATNDIVEREKWGKQVIVDEEVMFQTPVRTQSQILQEEVDRLNKGSDLDMILARHKAQGDPGSVPPPAAAPFNPQNFVPPVTTVATPANPEGTTILPSADELDAKATDNVPPAPPTTILQPPVATPAAPEAGQATVAATPPVPGNGESLTPLGNPPAAPTRETLMSYAKNTLMMDMTDQKTVAQLEAMSIPDLVENLKYEG